MDVDESMGPIESSSRPRRRRTFRLLFLFSCILCSIVLNRALVADPIDQIIAEQFIGNLTRNTSTNNNPDACTWPGFTCNSAALTLLRMSFCEVIGTIPPEIFTPGLSVLDLRGNYLIGTLPPQVSQSTGLTRLLLGKNALNGTIPESLASLPLIEMTIDRNKFSCPFPSALYNALMTRSGVSQCRFSFNLFDSAHDGSICNGTQVAPPGKSICHVYPLLSTEDFRNKVPDFEFSTSAAKFEVHGPVIRMQPKQPDGSVLPLVYSAIRMPSLIIEPPSIVETEDWYIPKFDNMTEVSPNIFQLYFGMSSAYASGMSFFVNVTSPATPQFALTLHNTQASPTSRVQFIPSMIVHSHIVMRSDNLSFACTTDLGLSARKWTCSSLSLYLEYVLQLADPLRFGWDVHNANMQFDGEASLILEYQGALEHVEYEVEAFISGDNVLSIVEKTGIFESVPVEYQGLDLHAELYKQSQSTGDIVWGGISMNIGFPYPPVASPNVSNSAIGAVALVPIAAVAAVAILLFLRHRRRRFAQDDSALSSALGSMADSGIDSSLLIDPKSLVIMQQLGSGSFGSVQLAMLNGEFVAVKTLSHSETQQQINEFLREAAVMASIKQSKNIVKLLGVCAESNSYSLVMEFCPRGSLSSFLKRRAVLSPYDEFKLLFSIVEGMVALSSSNVVHCDLAARNILLDERLFAKVSDFGYSRKQTAAGDVTRALAGQDANSVGPIKWQAPEVLNHDFGDHQTQDDAITFTLTSASDVWSYGCTVIEILTHKEPYAGYKGSLLQLANEIRHGNLNPLTQIERSGDNILPGWIVPVLRSCFAVKPEDRPTFREIRYQLTKANRDLFNQYENEIDDAESLLSSPGVYQPFPEASKVPTTPYSSWTSTVPSEKAVESANNADQQISRAPIEDIMNVDSFNTGKVDLSQVQTLSKLGEGNYGSVYLGISQGSYVAVKVLTLSSPLEEVKREAAVMTSIQQHRNIVQLYGLISDQDRLSLVMEFVPKGSLESYLKAAAGRITEGLQFKWAVGIARGMKTLAASKIVHRDLATRNILLDSTLESKISDFGMSRIVIDASQESSTRTDVGPIRWFAPECFDLKYSEKTDVWAYGCTLIEIATGEMPLSRLRVLDVVSAVRDQKRSPVEFIDQSASAVPPWLIETMQLCFAYDPSQRATFAELVTFLEEKGRSIQEVRDAEDEIQKRRQRRAGSLRLGDGATLRNVK